MEGSFGLQKKGFQHRRENFLFFSFLDLLALLSGTGSNLSLYLLVT
jgi:hypothetical protein